MTMGLRQFIKHAIFSSFPLAPTSTPQGPGMNHISVAKYKVVQNQCASVCVSKRFNLCHHFTLYCLSHNLDPFLFLPGQASSPSSVIIAENKIKEKIIPLSCFKFTQLWSAVL